MRKRSLEALDVKLEPDRLIINGFLISIPHISFVEEIRPRGTNGLVFKCTDTVLRRLVAVKIWIPRQDDRRDRSRQALAEASKIAQLNHKNIAQIYQCSQFSNGWIYSVMEYINGVNLDVFIKVHRSDFFQRYRLWKQLEESLNYSHELGIFHGDLHRGNILVVGETIKVIDFGTSIFAAKKIDSHRRETRLLIALSMKMFSRYKPSLRDIIEVDIRTLNPSLALHALSAWVNVLLKWQEMFAIARRDDWLETAMHHFAYEVIRVPVFSFSSLLEHLSAKKVSPIVQRHFLARCHLWAHTFLTKPVINPRTRIECVPFVLRFGEKDQNYNRSRLEKLVPVLRKAFYKNGPFQ